MPTSRIALALGALAVFFANQSVQVLAIPFYQMTLSVDPLWLALAMAVPLLVGSLWASLLSNWLSRQVAPILAYRRCLALGSCGLGGCFMLMWLVPPTWSSGLQLSYFAVCCVGFFLALPLLSVSFTSLLFAAPPSVQAKQFAVVGVVHKVGSLVYQWLVPLCQVSYFSSFISGVRQIGVAVALLLLTLPGLIAAWRWSTPALPNAAQPSPLTPEPALVATTSLTHTARQPAVWRLLALGALQLCGCAAVASYDFYLLVYSQHAGDLAAGATDKAWLSSLYAVAGLAWVPVLSRSQARWGALTTLSWVFALNAAGGAAKWWLFAQDAGRWVLLDALLCSVAWSAMVMLLPPLLRQASPTATDPQVSALHHWLVSISAALAMILSGFGLTLLQFSPQTSDTSLPWLRWLLSGGTVGCSLLALWLLWQIRRHLQPNLRTRITGV